MYRVTLGLFALLLASPVRAAEPAPGPPGFALHAAATLDAESFAYASSLRARPGAEGVTRVRLGPAWMAQARDDLADVRVVDGASRQWPFVLVPDAGREAMELRVEPPRVERGSSVWRLVPPVAPLVLDGITLRVDREVFDRGYRLSAGPAGGRDATLGVGRLRRTARDAGGEVALPLPRVRVTELTLTVDDGDEAPLPLSAARASSPVAELWLVAPAGEYTLLVGDAGARAPRYEIAGARDRVLAAQGGAAELGPLAPNPLRVPTPTGGDPRHTYALWLVMGLAVVALGALTLRLSRREPPAPPGTG